MKAFKALYHGLLEVLPDEWAIQLIYHRVYGRFADLREPRTFTEKLNWRKLHQRDPRFTLYSDKLLVKEEIARLVGPQHVIPTLWSGERPEDIPFESLVPPYVVKVTHGYGSNILVRRPQDADPARIRADLALKLRTPHGRHTRQWGYEGIKPRIVIERMLDIFGKGEPEDYKFFVYHGRALFIQVNVDRWTKDEYAYYDRDWDLLPAEPSPGLIDRPLPRPSALPEMLSLAERIGAAFDMVRVDLYQESGRVFFGETTFYHTAGYPLGLKGRMDELFGEPWRIESYPPPRAEPTR